MGKMSGTKMKQKKKVAFVFPGQGSQVVGMSKSFYNVLPWAKEAGAFPQLAGGQLPVRSSPVAGACKRPRRDGGRASAY